VSIAVTTVFDGVVVVSQEKSTRQPNPTKRVQHNFLSIIQLISMVGIMVASTSIFITTAFMR